jgi:hypothetical protein
MVFNPQEVQIMEYNRDYIMKVLEFLGHGEAGGVTEVRIFPKSSYFCIYGKRMYLGKVVSGYYDDYEKLVRDIRPFDGKGNIYVTLNPYRFSRKVCEKEHSGNMS